MNIYNKIVMSKIVSISKNPSSPLMYVLMHNNNDSKWPITALGSFDTEEEAEKVAKDEDVMNHYGGTLDDGDFYIAKIPYNASIENFKQFHEI